MSPMASARQSSQSGIDYSLKPSEALIEYLQNYARERPEVVALWCFGIGFVLGWKLKPW